MTQFAVGVAFLTGASLVTVSSRAAADITHVVAAGHTLDAIAHRYHVSVQAIVDANHLTDTRHLKPGLALVIPGVEGKEGATSSPPRPLSSAPHSTTAAIGTPGERRGREARPTKGAKGVIVAVRQGEAFRIRLKDARGRIADSALRDFARLSRQGTATHPPDPRLMALVAVVSERFGGKPIEVVSGYRAYTPTQYTPHSNHNYGKALDFRIRGVTNEALRDFCRTLRNAGCGYYPNSTFVHLDVRDTKAYWVDFSRPGEPPRYEKSGVGADEGTSDVPDEANEPNVEPSPPGQSPTGSQATSPLVPPPPAHDESERSL